MTAVTPAKPAEAKGYREFVIGNPKAKVTVIEYASLSCPHCAHFQTETYPKLKKDYIDRAHELNISVFHFSLPEKLASIARTS